MENIDTRDKKLDHKRIIANTSIVIVLFVVDLYLTLESSRFNLANLFSFIQNESIRLIVLSVVQGAILGISYGLVYAGVSIVYRSVWKISNKEHYLQGTWLHIHDKGNVRIGVVSIKQNFYDLNVSAKNIKPNSGLVNEKNTHWHYIGSKFHPNDSMGEALVGCYWAHRENESNKYGVHIFNNITTDRKGEPIKLEGVFGDIFKAEDKGSVDVSDKTGRLYLFKMPKSIAHYIEYKKSDFNSEKLSNIINSDDEEILNTDFVKTLRTVLNKNEIQEKYKLVLKEVENQPESLIKKEEIERWFAEILCSIVLVDVSITSREIEILNDLLGTKWEQHYIRMIFESVNMCKSGEGSLHEMMNELKNTNFSLWCAFKDLVNKSSQYIIECDGIVTNAEQQWEVLVDKMFT